jgi:vacuolar-type H+-ATPase subunit I/STV1
MTHMINRLAPAVVILLSMFVLAGCSGIFGESPREQADEAISNANQSISQHNKLFDEARSTYAEVKQEIESGDDPSKEKDNITDAKTSLQKARKDLQDARASLGTVDDLDVDAPVKKYASLLSEVGDGYKEAEKTYSEAQNLANEHPKLIEAAPK